jgi:subtilisin family serine protease
LCIDPSATVTLNGLPSFALTVPSSLANAASYTYLALYDPTKPSSGWTTVGGPATVAGSVFTIPSTTTPVTFTGGQNYCLMIFTLTSLLPTPTPVPAPTGTTVAANSSPYVCPQNDTNFDSVARATTGGTTSRVRRAGGLGRALPASTPGLLAVTYNASALKTGTASTLASARESAAGATLVRSFNFTQSTVTHVLSVPAGQLNTIAATLRTQSGVVSVAPTGAHRYSTTVTTPYYPNDPYFNGFTSAQNATADNPSTSNPAASTYHVAPYDESNVVPGQWDMHAIGLEKALAYGQPANGSGIFNAAALGSSSIKLAIIDTGIDPNHPELASKIVYQKCFISNPTGSQSTSTYETDPLGHGTDVAGIAAEASNNGLGFTGTGGNTVIYAYRVFPTPDDSCASDTSTDDQCGASTVDIASAIDDAIAQKVNVISMSLGGDVCSPAGVDSDSLEGAAIAKAIAANIVVVAASGNSAPSTVGVAAPGCDSGVIAAGATSLADGAANGSNVSGGSVASPIEYMTSYTQYGSPSTYQSSSSWGILAPGGDPADAETSPNGTVDDLHWIENIWTTTPYEANSSDTTFQGECDPDYPNGASKSGTIDCRTLIAGTSMATPHVAGAAALILSVNSSYQSPAAMKALLCSTADNLDTTAAGSSANLYNVNQGCGRLNVYRAMAKAVGDANLP